jgi:NAD(P)-dependent dehydrogenase (short-subunit alcohol dehydrogenase family)
VDTFAGKLAVVTGTGSGMGRELARQLAAAGASVATCDLRADALAETAELAAKEAADGARITAHECDVSDEAQVLAFRDAVLAAHETDRVELLFNNAGVGGGGSFVKASRADWDRVFGVNWGGVYHCTRAFLPALIAADEAVIVNTSSVNGFHATLGPGLPHTAYSTSKFAVKGFTEALMVDLRVNAPHVRAVVVMPGHIGTDIAINSRRLVQGTDEITDEEVRNARGTMTALGLVPDGVDDAAVRESLRAAGPAFRDNAPLTAAGAATIILDGVRAGQWRILVGEDAKALDEHVRSSPETAYDPGKTWPNVVQPGR